MKRFVLIGLLVVASLSACSHRARTSDAGSPGSSYTQRMIKATSSCDEMQRLYESNLASLDQLLANANLINPESPVIIAGTLVWGLNYNLAVRGRYQQAVARFEDTFEGNRMLEVLASEKNCTPLTPPMEAVRADLAAKEAARMKASEERRAQTEERNRNLQKND